MQYQTAERSPSGTIGAMAMQRQPLSHYLALEFPYIVIADDGSYFIEFPDLPGCMTQVEEASEIGPAAEEIRALWIETEYEDGHDIPEPAAQAEYSGRFVARVPKSLHRELVLAARREGMSLNAYVVYLLSERNLASQLMSRLENSNNEAVAQR
jgi:antitoxin HicB